MEILSCDPVANLASELMCQSSIWWLPLSKITLIKSSACLLVKIVKVSSKG